MLVVAAVAVDALALVVDGCGVARTQILPGRAEPSFDRDSSCPIHALEPCGLEGLIEC